MTKIKTSDSITQSEVFLLCPTGLRRANSFHIRPHPALFPFDYRKVFKYDLLGQHLVAKVARTEKYGVLFRVVYPFVEQKHLQLPLFE